MADDPAADVDARPALAAAILGQALVEAQKERSTRFLANRWISAPDEPGPGALVAQREIEHLLAALEAMSGSGISSSVAGSVIRVLGPGGTLRIDCSVLRFTVSGPDETEQGTHRSADVVERVARLGGRPATAAGSALLVALSAGRNAHRSPEECARAATDAARGLHDDPTSAACAGALAALLRTRSEGASVAAASEVAIYLTDASAAGSPSAWTETLRALGAPVRMAPDEDPRLGDAVTADRILARALAIVAAEPVDPERALATARDVPGDPVAVAAVVAALLAAR